MARQDAPKLFLLRELQHSRSVHHGRCCHKWAARHEGVAVMTDLQICHDCHTFVTCCPLVTAPAVMHGAAVLQLTQQEQLWRILPRHCISAPWTPPIVQATKNAVFTAAVAFQ